MQIWETRPDFYLGGEIFTGPEGRKKEKEKRERVVGSKDTRASAAA